MNFFKNKVMFSFHEVNLLEWITWKFGHICWDTMTKLWFTFKGSAAASAGTIILLIAAWIKTPQMFPHKTSIKAHYRFDRFSESIYRNWRIFPCHCYSMIFFSNFFISICNCLQKNIVQLVLVQIILALVKLMNS